MNGIKTVTKILTKILEIGHWVGMVLMFCIAVCSKALPQKLNYFINTKAFETETEISSYGFEVRIINSAGEIDFNALCLYAVGSIIIFSLMAMIFRNIYLIIKRSENETPFCKDNVRMFREIGIFSVSIPVCGLIMSTITALVLGAEAFENSINFDGFIMGIIIFCLSEFFVYGSKLEKDVDGLL